MKRIRVFVPVVLAAGLLLGLAFADPVQTRGLIKIPKNSALTASLLARLPVEVRQELKTCLLALADGRDQAVLRRNGVRFTVLARNVRGIEFFVVAAGPDDLASLRAAGQAIVVEPGTAVFWTAAANPAEAIPSGLPRKALAARPVRPDLRPRVASVRPARPAAAQDPFIETIVSLVSGSNLSASVQTLQDFQTRYASTTNCEAAGDFLLSAFSALGLDDVHFAPFTFSGTYSSRNVVGELTGTTYPDDVYIICAHYDSTSPSPQRLTLAPGADDNASGTAAVLEAARILASYELDYTVRFIAFSAEEWGLYGSRAYAAAAWAAGERIQGVINLDMIAYANALPEDLQIIVNPASEWLADRYIDAAGSYGPVGATKIVDASFLYSDHAPFWDSGYHALLAIEDWPLNNPYYHSTSDTIDKLNLDLFTSAARASLGFLAELAQPIKAGYPATPVGLTASPEVYSSLFNSLKVVHLSWAPQDDAAGYNIYRTNASHLDYVKINAGPIAGPAFTDEDVTASRTYYYVITAVGGTGLESNRSREVAVAANTAWETVTLLGLGSLRGVR